jgi:hypothetical protein
MRCSLYGPYPIPDPADYATCPYCGCGIVWVDEIANGYQGTDMLIAVCEKCEGEYDEGGTDG